jgi:Co/Zn/Cd efflux system component
MIKNILLMIFIWFGAWELIDTLLDAQSWEAINLKDVVGSIALIISGLALWLNFSNRELSKDQLQHENARKLRDRFYHDQMRSFLINICAIQRENLGRTSRVQVFVDDNGQAVRWRCIGSTAIGMATAGVRIDHWNGNAEQKFNLENAIMTTISVFEEATSLLRQGLITKQLIVLALGNDFPFVYKVIAKIIENYSNDGMMNFEKIEVERLNKTFSELFGPVKDLNTTVENLHISEDIENLETTQPVNA